MNARRNLAGKLRLTLVLVALVLAGSTAAVSTAPTPAHASPQVYTICFPVYSYSWTGQLVIIGWRCHDIPVLRYIDPCPPCPEAVIGFEHLVNPPDPWYVDDLLDGLDLLGQAAVNPRDAQQLRAAAQLEFAAAAQRVGDPGIRPGVVGRVNRQQNIIEPVPLPWLLAAGTDLASGLRLMQQGQRDAAMSEFDETYQEIAQQRPIGK
jgi:hypothetical protein